MPSSDSARDYVEKQGLFVPFAEQLFSGSGSPQFNNFRGDSATDVVAKDSDLLPTVCSTASVRWTGRAAEFVGDMTARVMEDTGLPAEDARPSAASRAANRKRARRQQVMEAVSRIKFGDKCYVNLLAWPEYEDEYPYPSPVEMTFVEAVYGDVIKGKGRRQLRKISVPVFDISHEVDVEWIETWGVHFIAPEGSKSITTSLPNSYSCVSIYRYYSG